jgi:hypothetical protein
MKDVLTKRRMIGEFETVALTQECSQMVQGKIPPKLKDPGTFTIPCSIADVYVGKALCDLGASINLMPLFIFKKLGIWDARPTTVTLQLPDISLFYPQGTIEDVLVRVDKFVFPADFIIMNFTADEETLVLLGRPFLATGRTLIDVEKGELTLRVNSQEVTFNVLKTMRNPTEEGENVSMLKCLDTLVHKPSGKTQLLVRKDLAPVDSKILVREGQKVLLYKSRLNLCPDKLKSRWSGPFKLLKIYPYGVVDLLDESTGQELTVSSKRMKQYCGDGSKLRITATLDKP